MTPFSNLGRGSGAPEGRSFTIKLVRQHVIHRIVGTLTTKSELNPEKFASLLSNARLIVPNVLPRVQWNQVRQTFVSRIESRRQDVAHV